MRRHLFAEKTLMLPRPWWQRTALYCLGRASYMPVPTHVVAEATVDVNAGEPSMEIAVHKGMPAIILHPGPEAGHWVQVVTATLRERGPNGRGRSFPVQFTRPEDLGEPDVVEVTGRTLRLEAPAPGDHGAARYFASGEPLDGAAAVIVTAPHDGVGPSSVTETVNIVGDESLATAESLSPLEEIMSGRPDEWTVRRAGPAGGELQCVSNADAHACRLEVMAQEAESEAERLEAARQMPLFSTDYAARVAADLAWMRGPAIGGGVKDCGPYRIGERSPETVIPATDGKRPAD